MVPGIEIKVTPDKDAPIIPKATIYQGERLFPKKKRIVIGLFTRKIGNNHQD